MVKDTARQKIAVVGAGISGITAAYVLSRKHDVVLYEKNNYVGGHTNTRVIAEGEDKGAAVDTGFIVCNERNYPNFYKMMSLLGVELRDAEMSFGFYSEESKLQYVGPAIKEFISVPKNFLNLKFCRMILEQRRFNKSILSDLKNGKLCEIPLGEYLRNGGYSSYFVEHYLTPLIASVWSSPDGGAYDFPTATFATFFNNHGMLNMSERPQWQTVVGGSHAYVKAFKERFAGELVTEKKVEKILRSTSGVQVQDQTGGSRGFDQVVIATHADEALALLAEPSADESRLLGSWRYSANKAVLHTDSAAMHGPKHLWASWNYIKRAGDSSKAPVAITYYMNKLQGLTTSKDYFVTLNPSKTIIKSSIVYEVDYTHPVYTPQSVASQKELARINGEHNTYFCGAHLGYGFHEDGVQSALAVALKFGLTL